MNSNIIPLLPQKSELSELMKGANVADWELAQMKVLELYELKKKQPKFRMNKIEIYTNQVLIVSRITISSVRMLLFIEMTIQKPAFTQM